MSGIVGSKLNIRGSGLVGSLGTDGQHLLSAGAGKTNVFETAAAGGGKVLQVVGVTDNTFRTFATNAWYDHSGLDLAITPSAVTSKIFLSFGVGMKTTNNDYSNTIFRDTTNLGHADNGLALLKFWNYFGGSILDSPSSTSEIIYSHQYRANDSVAALMNYVGGETDPGTNGHLIAMEIDGS